MRWSVAAAGARAPARAAARATTSRRYDARTSRDVLLVRARSRARARARARATVLASVATASSSASTCSTPGEAQAELARRAAGCRRAARGRRRSRGACRPACGAAGRARAPRTCRSVCGCMPTSAAATPIMYLGVLVGHAAPATAHPPCAGARRAGSGRSRSANFSSASRCCRVSFFGTHDLDAREQVALAVAVAGDRRAAPLDAQHARRRCVPAGTFRRTRSPSGVGTSIVAPEAASTNSHRARRRSRRRRGA